MATDAPPHSQSPHPATRRTARPAGALLEPLDQHHEARLLPFAANRARTGPVGGVVPVSTSRGKRHFPRREPTRERVPRPDGKSQTRPPEKNQTSQRSRHLPQTTGNWLSSDCVASHPKDSSTSANACCGSPAPSEWRCPRRTKRQGQPHHYRLLHLRRCQNGAGEGAQAHRMDQRRPIGQADGRASAWTSPHLGCRRGILPRLRGWSVSESKQTCKAL